jgi:hypothetical protein
MNIYEKEIYSNLILTIEHFTFYKKKYMYLIYTSIVYTVMEISTGPTDRLSGKLFCQPLPLRIDKSRFSVNST